MKLRLKDIEPNPMRDLTIDPLDKGQVATLAESIGKHGFWGGVTARHNKETGKYQCAAGWHRIAAAIQQDIVNAEIFVGNFDDEQMLRIYATENATQRGNDTLSVAGAVAGALRLLLRERLQRLGSTNVEPKRGGDHGQQSIGEQAVLAKLGGTKTVSARAIREQIAALKSSGHYDRIAHEVAAEVEAKHAAELARIAEAQAEAERKEQARVTAEEARRKAVEEAAQRKAEQKAAAEARAAAKVEDERRKATEREAEAQRRTEESVRQAEEAERQAAAHATAAKEATAKAKTETARKSKVEAGKARAATAKAKAEIDIKTKPPKFDIKGVGAILKSSNHLEAFRRVVTQESAATLLPVDKQAEVAQYLVDLVAERRAKEDGAKGTKGGKSGRTELTSQFIEFELGLYLAMPRLLQRTFDRAEEKAAAEALAKATWLKRWNAAVQELRRHAGAVSTSAYKLPKLAKERPQGVEVTMRHDFTLALSYLNSAIQILERFSKIDNNVIDIESVEAHSAKLIAENTL